MTQRDWQQPSAHVLGVFLNGQEIADRTPRGAPIEDGSFLLLFNAHHEDMTFTLPARRFGAEWIHEICTHEPALEAGAQRWSSRGEVPVPARSMKLLLRA
jgi:glycogen operon protein